MLKLSESHRARKPWRWTTTNLPKTSRYPRQMAHRPPLPVPAHPGLDEPAETEAPPELPTIPGLAKNCRSLPHLPALHLVHGEPHQGNQAAAAVRASCQSLPRRAKTPNGISLMVLPLRKYQELPSCSHHPASNSTNLTWTPRSQWIRRCLDYTKPPQDPQPIRHLQQNQQQVRVQAPVPSGRGHTG